MSLWYWTIGEPPRSAFSEYFILPPLIGAKSMVDMGRSSMTLDKTLPLLLT